MCLNHAVSILQLPLTLTKVHETSLLPVGRNIQPTIFSDSCFTRSVLRLPSPLHAADAPQHALFLTNYLSAYLRPCCVIEGGRVHVCVSAVRVSTPAQCVCLRACLYVHVCVCKRENARPRLILLPLFPLRISCLIHGPSHEYAKQPVCSAR